MRRKNLAALFVSMIIMLVTVNAQAAFSGNDKDTDTLFVDAEVVEITEARLSVIARSGVEHVIAIDTEKTRVTRGGKSISLKEVREGDIITIELDEKNPMKFARNISMQTDATAVARNRR